jgi:hypothetical protein
MIGQDFTRHLFIKELTEETTINAGLIVFACIFNRVYETSRKVVGGLKIQCELSLISICGNGFMLPFLTG